MRIPSYLSPSQFSLWHRDREAYYLEQLSESRTPRPIQTKAQAIGSSFDAYVKSAMFEYLFGHGTNPKFEFETLFESQVDESLRDWALENGQYLFECYKISGSYNELLSMLNQSKYAPQFEWTIKGEVEEVPLLGKPDLRFIHKEGAHILLDWKVSGYCSKYTTSPVKNYRLLRDGWLGDQSKTHNTPHKNYEPFHWKGITIHKGYLEDCSPGWADQLAMYGWILGEPVGSEDTIVCIDQLVAKPMEPYPKIRVANQAARISSGYQKTLMEGLKTTWNIIQSGHIFDDLSREDSDARCEILDRQAQMTFCRSEELAPVQAFLAKQQQIYRF